MTCIFRPQRPQRNSPDNNAAPFFTAPLPSPSRWAKFCAISWRFLRYSCQPNVSAVMIDKQHVPLLDGFVTPAWALMRPALHHAHFRARPTEGEGSTVAGIFENLAHSAQRCQLPHNLAPFAAGPSLR